MHGNINHRDFCRLIAKIKNISPTEVRFSKEEIALTESEKQTLEKMLKRYERNEPISKILNVREFWKSEFFINEHVLDPRPDTELIIEETLSRFPRDLSLNILDIGTGSGCILLSLLQEYPNAIGIGIDVSAEAIEVANFNKNRLGVTSANFKNISWNDFQPTQKFSLVVSNPPYIKTSDIATLDANVREYDPLVALDGGENGLQAYEEICATAKNLLAPGGAIIFEIGFDQADDVSKILQKNSFSVAAVKQDIQNLDRVVVGIDGNSLL